MGNLERADGARYPGPGKGSGVFFCTDDVPRFWIGDPEEGAPPKLQKAEAGV